MKAYLALVVGIVTAGVALIAWRVAGLDSPSLLVGYLLGWSGAMIGVWPA